MKPLVRNALIALAALLALAAGFAAWPRETPYAGVASIAETQTYQDPALLARAWALPVAATYAASPYEYQANPSFCGPTTIANLLRSEGKSVDQTSVLEGSNVRPIFGILPRGLTLDQEADLARHATDREVTILRDLDLEAFRAELARTNHPATRYIINFHRGPLFGEGHGHFSPILGYLAEEDLVFVGDVNRDFQPFLVSSERLFAAMDTFDTDSGVKRGLLRIEAP